MKKIKRDTIALLISFLSGFFLNMAFPPDMSALESWGLKNYPYQYGLIFTGAVSELIGTRGPWFWFGSVLAGQITAGIINSNIFTAFDPAMPDLKYPLGGLYILVFSLNALFGGYAANFAKWIIKKMK